MSIIWRIPKMILKLGMYEKQESISETHEDLNKPVFTLMQKAFDTNDKVTEILECLWPKLDEIDYICTEVFDPHHELSPYNGERRLARKILDILNGEGEPSMHDGMSTFSIDAEGVHEITEDKN